jgi:putative ABC transport system permease protein
MTRKSPGERWYTRLLRLYPKDFRDEFGGEMTRLYRDRGREECWWSLWRSLVVDLVRTASSQHLSILKQDLRHAGRGLRRTPVVTATAVLTLALGVGASTTVYSVVHAVLLRPLPYPEADRLVEVFEEDRSAGAGFRASALNYLSWTERSESFDAIGAFGSTGVTLTDAGDPDQLRGSVVTASLFQVLRIPPIAGRTLQADDEQRAGARVVVLSEPLWRSRFGGDAGIIGRWITLDGERHQVVGVMPRAFREVGRAQVGATAEAQVFLPMIIDRTEENRGNHTLRVVGRLRRDVPLERAREEMRAVAAAMEREFPATNTNWGVRIDALSDTMLDPQVKRSLLLMLGAVTIVFLIASANVANLLLARGTERHAELALRTALGAGRSRLVRQLLTESGCLAMISGLAGVVVAAVTHPVVRALLPPTLPRLDEMRLDLNVLAFGLLISIASALVFGVVPALRASRLDLSRSLTSVGRSTLAPSRVRLRQTLIVTQIALATTLLAGAVLLLQSFVRLQRVPLGFESDAVLTARVSLPRHAYPDAERVGPFYERLIASLQESGQLRTVAVATSAPFAPGVRAGFRPADRGLASIGGGGNSIVAEYAAEHIVSGDYFRVLGVPLQAGRSFNELDTPGSTAVAVVSQRLARMYWPDTSPLGQTLERGQRLYEVIGVVGDIRGSDTQGPRGGGPDREPRAAVYFAASQLPQRSMTLLVRPARETTSAIATIRESVRELDPTVALQQVRPLRDWFADSVAPTRLTTTLATVFALSALLLTSVGIYGVLAYTVASRTREIGVRMAMGATRGDVIGLVLREGMTWAAGGIVLGLIGAFAAARLIAALLFEVPARDPATLATVGSMVALVALAACAIPAARAVRIDPTLAMRTE